MSAHTKGPWEVDVLGGITARINGGNRLVARVIPTPVDDKRADFDRRLIAAAPELLEALRAQIAAFDGDTFDEIEDEYGLGTAQRIFVAREAIAKATGEQP